MDDPSRCQPLVVVFSSPEHHLLNAVATTVRATGRDLWVVDQVGRGLAGLLHQRTHRHSWPIRVIILGPLSSLVESAIANAVHSLPGFAELPIALTGDLPSLPTKCVAICEANLENDLAVLLSQDQQASSAPPLVAVHEPGDRGREAEAARPSKTSEPLTALPARVPLVFDPVPLQRVEVHVPGSAQQIVAIHLGDLPAVRSRITQFQAEDNHRALAKEAHRLKGASGSIGGQELSRASAHLEQCAKGGDRAGILSACNGVLAAMDRLSEQLGIQFPQPTHQPVSQPAPQPAKVTPMRILITDDDHVCAGMLSGYLKPFGTCTVSSSGEDAIRLFTAALVARSPFGLVCLDIQMQGLDGQATLRSLRAIEAAFGRFGSSAATVLMTTCLGDVENVKAAFRSQCEGYLIKPIDEDQLVKQLAKLNIKPAAGQS